MTFGQYIRQLRKNKGLSLDEICEKLSITKGYLSFIERGIKRPPKDEIIRGLAEVLGEDATRLLYLAHREKVPSEVHNLTEKIEELQRLTVDLKMLMVEPEPELKLNNIALNYYIPPKCVPPVDDVEDKGSPAFMHEPEPDEILKPKINLYSAEKKTLWHSMAAPFIRAEKIDNFKEKRKIPKEELDEYYQNREEQYRFRSSEIEEKLREIENAIEFLAKRLPTHPKNIQAIIDELVDLSPKDLAYILGVIKTYRMEILNKK